MTDKTVYKPKPLEISKEKTRPDSKKQRYASVAIHEHQQQLKKHPELVFYDKPVTVALPWYIKYFFYIIWGFIVTVIFMMVNAYFQFKPQITWWSKHGGKTYKDYFSMSLLAQYKFSLGYFFLSLFSSKNVTFDSSGQKEFMFNLICSYAPVVKGDDPEKFFLQPYHICETIAVGTFTDPGGIDWGDGGLIAGKNGWPASQSQWKILLKHWGLPDNYGTDPIDLDKWKQSDNQNFLYHQYNLQPDTGFIESFVYNLASDPKSNLPWYPQGFAQAVGLNAQTIQNVDYTGGWWGLMKFGFGTEKDLSYAEISRVLYAYDNILTPRTPCDNLSIIGSGIGGALGAGIGIGVLSPIGGLAAGAISLTSTLVQGYHGCGKF